MSQAEEDVPIPEGVSLGESIRYPVSRVRSFESCLKHPGRLTFGLWPTG